MKKNFNCFNIIEANLKAVKEGKPIPYTKQQFSKSEHGGNSLSMYDWNLNLPTAEQFTKAEHSKGKYFDATAISKWNIDLPKAEQFTKAEHSKAEYCNKFAREEWNMYLPKAEQYTDAEINK